MCFEAVGSPSTNLAPKTLPFPNGFTAPIAREAFASPTGRPMAPQGQSLKSSCILRQSDPPPSISRREQPHFPMVSQPQSPGRHLQAPLAVQGVLGSEEEAEKERDDVGDLARARSRSGLCSHTCRDGSGRRGGTDRVGSGRRGPRRRAGGARARVAPHTQWSPATTRRAPSAAAAPGLPWRACRSSRPRSPGALLASLRARRRPRPRLSSLRARRRLRPPPQQPPLAEAPAASPPGARRTAAASARGQPAPRRPAGWLNAADWARCELGSLGWL